MYLEGVDILPSGASTDEYTVSYPTGFTLTTPLIHRVRTHVIAPPAADDLILHQVSNVGPSGFTAFFSSDIPAIGDDYRLFWAVGDVEAASPSPVSGGSLPSIRISDLPNVTGINPADLIPCVSAISQNTEYRTVAALLERMARFQPQVPASSSTASLHGGLSIAFDGTYLMVSVHNGPWRRVELEVF